MGFSATCLGYFANRHCKFAPAQNKLRQIFNYARMLCAIESAGDAPRAYSARHRNSSTKWFTSLRTSTEDENVSPCTRVGSISFPLDGKGRDRGASGRSIHHPYLASSPSQTVSERHSEPQAKNLLFCKLGKKQMLRGVYPESHRRTQHDIRAICSIATRLSRGRNRTLSP